MNDRMTPFAQFCNGLYCIRTELTEQIDELITFAEVMKLKQNCIEMDDNGYLYVTASGPVEEVITIMHSQLERLERIKRQKDNPN